MGAPVGFGTCNRVGWSDLNPGLPIMNNTPETVVEPALPAPDTLHSHLERALQAARAAGADAVEAGLDHARALTVRVRRGEIEAVEFHADRQLVVSAYRGQRCASATTTELSGDGIERVARKAAAIAAHTGEDPWAGLADADLMATDWPELDLHHPWNLGVDAAVDLARACEDAALAVDSRMENSEGAEVDTGERIAAYANSHGFFGCQRGTSHGFGCAVIAREGDDMVRDYWSTSARQPSMLEDAVAVGQRAGRRAAQRLGAVTPKTTQAPVLFPPEMAGSLFAHLCTAIAGGSLYRDASFLKDRLGEKLFPEWLQLVQRPHLRAASGSAGFDGDGVATVQRDLVRDGVLTGYLLGSYSARRLGTRTTGNAGGVFNLCVEGGTGDLATLMRRMDKGLLVTQMMGQGVNIVTGDYSRGAAGFWVEGGEIAYPVENVTIAGHLGSIFSGIAGLGDDVDVRENIRAPSVLVDAMTIAGK